MSFGLDPTTSINTDMSVDNITINEDFIELWGHDIIINKDGDSHTMKCDACEKEESVPEILTMSSGFRETLYKLYIFAEFKHDSCKSKGERIEDIMKDRDGVNKYKTISGNDYYTIDNVTINGADVDAEKLKKEIKHGSSYTVNTW